MQIADSRCGRSGSYRVWMLVAQLLADGYARVDSLGVGLDVGGNGAIIDAAGRTSDRVFAVAPMSQAALWESIAVQDIRLQAASLARRLVGQAGATDPISSHTIA
jgi:uncharacterized NAD(P)/FAD-binding protein YdhS